MLLKFICAMAHLSGKLKCQQVLLISVTLPPLNKLILFQLANFHSIFSNASSQIDFNLNGDPKGSPRYFLGEEDILQIKIEAILSTLGQTLPELLPA